MIGWIKMLKIGALLRDRSGAAAVESAMAILVMMAILLPLIDFGRYISMRIELKQALRAGGHYAMIDIDNTIAVSNSGTISTVVTDATNLDNITVTVGAITCECFDGATSFCPGNASYVTCTGSIAPGGFLPLTASATFDPLFTDVGGFTENMTVTESMDLRIY